MQKLKTGIPTEKKREIVNSIAGKSSSETEREFLRLSSQPASAGKERIRSVSKSLSEICFFASQNLLNDLEQLRGLLAHKHPSLCMAELIAIMAQITLAKLDLARRSVTLCARRSK